MAEQSNYGGNDYLIAVTLRDFDNFSRVLGAIEAIQEASKKGAKMGVTVDPSSLMTVEDRVAEAVSKGVGKGMSEPSNGALLHDTGGRTSPALMALRSAVGKLDETLGDNLLRELRANTTALNLLRRNAAALARDGGYAPASTGGTQSPQHLVAEFNPVQLTQAFNRIGEQLSGKIASELQRIPQYFNPAQFLREMDNYKDARQAGFRRPFAPGVQGIEEAARVVQDPQANVQKKAYARRFLLDAATETSRADVQIEREQRRATSQRKRIEAGLNVTLDPISQEEIKSAAADAQRIFDDATRAFEAKGGRTPENRRAVENARAYLQAATLPRTNLERFNRRINIADKGLAAISADSPIVKQLAGNSSVERNAEQFADFANTTLRGMTEQYVEGLRRRANEIDSKIDTDFKNIPRDALPEREKAQKTRAKRMREQANLIEQTLGQYGDEFPAILPAQVISGAIGNLRSIAKGRKATDRAPSTRGLEQLIADSRAGKKVSDIDLGREFSDFTQNPLVQAVLGGGAASRETVNRYNVQKNTVRRLDADLDERRATIDRAKNDVAADTGTDYTKYRQKVNKGFVTPAPEIQRKLDVIDELTRQAEAFRKGELKRAKDTLNDLSARLPAALNLDVNDISSLEAALARVNAVIRELKPLRDVNRVYGNKVPKAPKISPIDIFENIPEKDQDGNVVAGSSSGAKLNLKALKEVQRGAKRGFSFVQYGQEEYDQLFGSLAFLEAEMASVRGSQSKEDRTRATRLQAQIERLIKKLQFGGEYFYTGQMRDQAFGGVYRSLRDLPKLPDDATVGADQLESVRQRFGYQSKAYRSFAASNAGANATGAPVGVGGFALPAQGLEQFAVGMKALETINFRQIANGLATMAEGVGSLFDKFNKLPKETRKLFIAQEMDKIAENASTRRRDEAEEEVFLAMDADKVYRKRARQDATYLDGKRNNNRMGREVAVTIARQRAQEAVEEKRTTEQGTRVQTTERERRITEREKQTISQENLTLREKLVEERQIRVAEARQALRNRAQRTRTTGLAQFKNVFDQETIEQLQVTGGARQNLFQFAKQRLLGDLDTELKQYGRSQRAFTVATSRAQEDKAAGRDPVQALRGADQADRAIRATMRRMEPILEQVLTNPLTALRFMPVRESYTNFRQFQGERRAIGGQRRENQRDAADLRTLRDAKKQVNEELADLTKVRQARRDAAVEAKNLLDQANAPGPQVGADQLKRIADDAANTRDKLREVTRSIRDTRKERSVLVNGTGDPDATGTDRGILSVKGALAGRGIINKQTLQDEQQRLLGLYANATAGENRWKSEMLSRLQVTMQASKALRDQSGVVEEFGDKLKALFNYAFAGAIVYNIIGAFNQAISQANRLETIMANIQAVLESKSISDRLKIERGVLDSARDYAASIEESGSIAKLFAQTGASPEKTIELTRAALLGVRGAGLDANQVTELLIAVDNLSNERVKGEEIIDRISAVESKYAVTAQDISVAIQRVGALATQLQPNRVGGIDAFDLTAGATTSIVESTRVTGNQAATALRFMFARLAAPDVSGQLQSRFGINLASNKEGTALRPLIDILSDLAKRYAELKGGGNTIAAGQLLTTFAGARQVNAAAALLENWGKTMEVARVSSEAFGEAQRRVAIEMNTLESKTKQLNVSLVDFVNSLLNNTGVRELAKRGVDATRAFLEEGRDDPAGTLARGGTQIAKYGAVVGLAIPALAGIGKFLLAISSFKTLAGVMQVSSIARATPIIGGLVRFFAAILRIGRLFTVGGLVLAAGGVALSAYQSLNQGKIDASRRRDAFGLPDLDRDSIVNNSRTKEFQTAAETYGTTADGLVDALVEANRRASAAVRERFGAKAITGANGLGRTTDPALSAFYNEALRGAIIGDGASGVGALLPNFSSVVGDRDEQLEVIKKLLNETAVQLNAIPSVRNAQTAGQLSGALEAERERFTQARQVRSVYDPARMGDLTRGPGLNFSADVARSQGLSDGQRVGAYRQILNSISPSENGGKALGDALSDFAVTIDGQKRNFMTALDQMVKSGLTMGQALDAVARQAFALTDLQRRLVEQVRQKVVEGTTNAPAYAVDQQVLQLLNNPTALGNAGVSFDNTTRLGAAQGLGNQQSLFQFEVERNFQRFGIDAKLRDKLRETDLYRTQIGDATFERAREDALRKANQFLVDLVRQFDPARASEIQASLRADEDSANRPSYRSQVGNRSGRSFARDRVLEALVGFGVNEAQNRGLSANLGRSGIGFNGLQAGQQSAQQLLSSLVAARAQTQGDLLRAANELKNYKFFETDAQFDFAQQNIMDATEDGRPARRVAPIAKTIDQVVGAQDPKNLQALKQRVAYLREAVDVLGNDKVGVVNALDPQDQQLLRELVGADDSTLLASFSRIVEFARRLTEVRQRQVLLAQQELDANRLTAEIDTQRAESAQRLAVTLAQNEIRTQERLGNFGAAFARRRALVGQERDFQIGRARTVEQSANAQARLDPNLGALDIRFREWANAIERIKREEEAILDARNREQELLLEERARLDDDRRGFVDQGITSSTQGLREAFKSFRSLQELQKRDGDGNRQLLPAIITPLIDTVQERLVNNVVDNLFGPQGLFGDSLRAIFSEGPLQDAQQDIRERGFQLATRDGTYRGSYAGVRDALARLQAERARVTSEARTSLERGPVTQSEMQRLNDAAIALSNAAVNLQAAADGIKLPTAAVPASAAATASATKAATAAATGAVTALTTGATNPFSALAGTATPMTARSVVDPGMASFMSQYTVGGKALRDLLSGGASLPTPRLASPDMSQYTVGGAALGEWLEKLSLPGGRLAGQDMSQYTALGAAVREWFSGTQQPTGTTTSAARTTPVPVTSVPATPRAASGGPSLTSPDMSQYTVLGAALSQSMENVKLSLSRAVSGFTADVGTGMQTFGTATQQSGAAFVTGLQDVSAKIGSGFTTVKGSLTTALNGLTSDVTLGTDSFGTAMRQSGAASIAGWTELGSAVERGMQSMFTTVGAKIQSAVDQVTAMINALSLPDLKMPEWLKNLAPSEAETGSFGAAKVGTVPSGGNVVYDVPNAARRFWDTVTEGAREVPGKLPSAGASTRGAPAAPAVRFAPESYTGRDEKGVPRYFKGELSEEERGLLQRELGISDPSKLYIGESGFLNYDTRRDPGLGVNVPTERVGGLSIRRDGETWEEAEKRAMTMMPSEMPEAAFTEQTSLDKLDPKVQGQFRRFITVARKAGFDVGVVSTARAVEREALHFQQGNSYTLTSTHSDNRAVDFSLRNVKGDPSRGLKLAKTNKGGTLQDRKAWEDWWRFRTLAKQEGFSLIGEVGETWDWGHLALPDKNVQPGYHSIEEALEAARAKGALRVQQTLGGDGLYKELLKGGKGSFLHTGTVRPELEVLPDPTQPALPRYLTTLIDQLVENKRKDVEWYEKKPMAEADLDIYRREMTQTITEKYNRGFAPRPDQVQHIPVVMAQYEAIERRNNSLAVGQRGLNPDAYQTYFENYVYEAMRDNEDAYRATLRKDRLLKNAIGAPQPNLSGVPLDEQERRRAAARAQLQTRGVTDDQRAAYKPRISEAAYHNITPIGYQYKGEEINNTLWDVLVRKQYPLKEVVKREAKGDLAPFPEKQMKQREDAWRMYLGLPQLNSTFDVSDYAPANDKTGQPYLKIKDMWSELDVPGLYLKLLEAEETTGKASMPTYDHTAGVMGRHNFNLGRDDLGTYMSYYDLWDLTAPHADKVGKPYEIYDRLYVDPVTGQRLAEQPTRQPTGRPNTSRQLAQQFSGGRTTQLSPFGVRADVPMAFERSGLMERTTPVPVSIESVGNQIAQNDFAGFMANDFDGQVMETILGAQDFVQDFWMREQQTKLQRQSAQQSLIALGGSIGGGWIGNQLSPNRNANYASEGSSLGGVALPALSGVIGKGIGKLAGPALGKTIGGALAGPIGFVAGSVLGGLVGGLFKRNTPKEPPTYAQAERIERNTRESVTLLENNNRQLLNLDNRMLNVPASFTIPEYRPITGGAMSVQNSYSADVSVVVQGSNLGPAEIRRAVEQGVQDGLRKAGTHTSLKY